MEAAIPEAFLRLPGICRAVLVHRVHQRELPGRGGGRLDVVQVGGVPPQQFPDGRELLLLQPPAVKVLVGLEGFPGVQGQQPHRRGGPEQVSQGGDPAPHPLGGQHGQVIGPEHKKDQLPLGGFHAVIGELGDPHELAGGQALPQLFFLFSVQVSFFLHSKYCCFKNRKHMA